MRTDADRLMTQLQETGRMTVVDISIMDLLIMLDSLGIDFKNVEVWATGNMVIVQVV